MRGAFLPGDRQVDLREVPDPQPGRGQVVLPLGPPPDPGTHPFAHWLPQQQALQARFAQQLQASICRQLGPTRR